MVAFWVVTPCGLVGVYQRFEGTYCLHIRGLKTTMHIFTTVGASNLIYTIRAIAWTDRGKS
jgi:hypothetical protein